MSATNTNAATDKENLTVRAWGLAGVSVVKECLTTESAKNSYRSQQNASPRAVDADFERVKRTGDKT
ncbi:MAG: hypothetical protein A3F78_21040 [Burkholderiales bacterium RIFCSPLOWO2_12_FULL_61_40]|nr:MAG: hypothetical protein A3F78_21040 [Burkholderiales bacterium RIFCSPLOWO2_12_FULL_61_40]